MSQENCLKQMSRVNQSLESSIELFLSKKIGSKCLFKKARRQLWDNEDVSLAHMALAVAHYKIVKKSDVYLQEVCKDDESSTLCQFSQWMEQFAYKKRLDRQKFIQLAQRGQTPNFIKVMGAAIFREQGDFATAEQVIRQLRGDHEMEALVARLAFHSLVGQMKLSEAEWLVKTHSVLDKRDILHFVIESSPKIICLF
jgi:hypothetical protein